MYNDDFKGNEIYQEKVKKEKTMFIILGIVAFLILNLILFLVTSV